MKLSDFDGISERLIGWGCIGATVTEYIDPHALAMSLPQAAGLGVFGFLVATGRASVIVKRIAKIISDD